LFWPLRVLLAIGAGLAMYVVVERRIMAARKRKPLHEGAPASPPLPTS
jgi:hypothetical protein